MYATLEKLKHFLFQFIGFIYNPNKISFENLEFKQKCIQVGIYFAIIDFFLSIILWLFTEIFEKIGLFNPLITKTSNNFNIIEVIAIGIIIVPILEEFIFRYPLKYFTNKKYFKWVLYTFCIGFGFIHLSNYQIDNSHILFAPLIVIIQICGAFIFSFIRLKYGFWYAVLIHMIHNIWSLSWKYTIGFDL